MKNRFTLSKWFQVFAIIFLMVGWYESDAQTTNNQTTVTQCFNGLIPPMNNTTGTLAPAVNFTQGTGPGQIPPGHKVVDVIVEIVWSKTDDGSCSSITGTPADLEDVGFIIQGPPATGPVRYLAVSDNTTGLPISGNAPITFTGTFPGAQPGVVQDTIVFRHGANPISPLPSTPNHPARDTVAPNGDPLNFYCGQDPYGTWAIGGIDDAPAAGPQLCIHSYCITLITCDHDTLVASCKANPTVALDPSTGTHNFVFADLDSISDVSCVVKNITFAPASVNCSNIGTPVPVTMTIRDHLDSVESCVSTVNVADLTPPVIFNCSPDTILTLFLDSMGRDTFYADSVFMTDNCGPIIKEVRPFVGASWGSFIPFSCVLNAQQFWVRGTDGNGNMDSCVVRVVVRDTIAPTAVCGRDTVYVGNGPVTVSAISLDGGSFDVCPPIIGRSLNGPGQPSPTYTCADLGIDTLSLYVSDISGNWGSCDTAILSVLDTTPPSAICQTVNVYVDAGGNANVTAAQVNNNSADTCSIASMNINGGPSVAFNCTHVGTPQSVTLNVIDGSGNANSCNATVNVLDTIPPTAICRNFTVYLDAAGVATLTADSLNNNSVDACTGTNLTFQIGGNATTTFSCADIANNPNSVTLTVLDAYNNSSTCSANVTVLDTISPTANCANPTVYLNNAGLATVSATQLSAGSSDNCTVTDSFVNVVGIGTTNYTCADLFAPQPTTLIIRDASNNLGTCVGNVTVLDTVDPTALCRTSLTVALDASGNATVTPADIDSASTDNCGLVSYLINGVSSQVYNCADTGSLVAILTVQDTSGNSATCPSTINIIDNTPPTATCQLTNVYLNAAGLAAITPNDVLAFPATNDNCGPLTTTFLGGATNIIYDCDSIGPHTVTVVVSDNNSSTTCQTTVTVLDTVDPIASCRTAAYQVQLDASGTGFVVPVNVDNNSSDICGIDTMLVNGVDSVFYTCANIGNTAVTLSILDASGNQSTCVAQVVVNDPLPPTANCQNITVYLDNTGVVTVNASQIDNGSTDNCSVNPTIGGLPSVTYSCSDIGTSTAQLLVFDPSGNSSQCAANITIQDTIPPVANCIPNNSLTVYLDNTCFASVSAATFNNNSTDNCSGLLQYSVNGAANATFTATNLTTNPNPIVLTVTDGVSGNTDTCHTTVIVRDSTPPTILCRPDTLQLNGAGTATLLPSNINNGSNDNCNTISTFTVNGSPFLTMNCTNLGTNNVTLVGTDASGNADSCTTTVFVEDVTAPNSSCNATVTVILDPFTSSGTLAVADVDMGSSDNCGIVNTLLSQTAFGCGDIPNNPHVVTMTVTDASGNADSCTTQVTVVDTVAPVANCVASPINLALVGSTVSTTAAAINNNSTDNCSIASLSLSQSTFSCANIGANIVTLTVTDSSGNSGTCAVTVNVTDNVNPSPFCNNPTVSLPASGTVSVAAVDLGSSSFDNCSIDTILANGLDSVTFTCADLGPNIVNVFIQDPSNNTANCLSTVTVVDGVNPVANCVGGQIDVHLDGNGIGVLTPADVNNGSTDNCGIAGLSLSKDTFNCADIFNNPVTTTLTVTDQSGNTSTCNAQVNVIDTISPVVSCQPVTVNIHLSSGGLATVTANMFDNGSADACGLASLSFTGAPNPVNCSHVGQHTIFLTATDVNGNSNTCQTTLTVLDTVAPTLNCNNITLDLDNFGNLTVDSLTPGLYTLSDACGTASLTFNGTNAINYTCNDVGVDTILLTATDISNNTSTCNAVITIQDVTPPSVTCAITTQYLDVNGQLPVDPAWITASIIEACGIDTTYTSPDTLTCANVGAFNSVTLTVVDVNGNSSSCTGNVTVVDTIPPTMVCRDTSICLNGGFVSVSAADVDGGTTDACGLSVIQTINGSNNIIYTCADLGPQQVVLQMQDIHGNVDTCHSTVTVQDCQAPTAVCQGNYTAFVGPTGFVAVQAIDLDFGSTDLCGIDSTSFRINGLDSIVYSCAHIGTSDTVIFTVADLYGNIDTCTSIITIQDNTNPVANCGNAVSAVLSQSTGIAIVQALALNNPLNPSNDNCTITGYLINGQTQDTFDCTMLGAQTVTLTVVDQSGNTNSCQATVNVQDITPPTASCQFNTTVALDPTGQVAVLATDLVTTASDNCGIQSITGNGLDTLFFTCDSIGSNLITVVVTDSSGNTFTCAAIVNVQDTTSPVAVCPTNPIPAYLNNNSIVWIPAQALDSASFDNCGITSYLINGTDSVLYNCGQVNASPPPTATLTVIDSSGNSNTCSVTIQVLDTIPPNAQCKDFTIQLSPAGVAFVTPVSIDSFSSDNCGINSYLINNQQIDTFDCSNVGSSNTAVLTVVDLYGNTSFCTSNVTVVDATPPTILCPPTIDTFYLGANGLVTVDPRDVANASDTCTILYWFIDGLVDSTFNCSQVGNHLVTIRVEDPSGNSASCNTVIAILDTIPPTSFCQDITVALDSTGSVEVTGADIGPFNTDNCGIIDTLINNQTSVFYTCDSLTGGTGSTTLTAYLTLVDASNNQSTCTAQVTVLDNIAPVIACHDTVTVQLNQDGIAVVQAVTLDNGTVDACTPLDYKINGLDTFIYTCQNVVTPPIAILTVTDANGNGSTCPSVIQVLDNLPPVPMCQDIDVYLNASGNVTVPVSAIDNGSVDNCLFTTLAFSGGATSRTFNCSDTGAHVVTLVVTDLYGNADSCTATITVRDTIPPTVVCNGTTVNLTTAGPTVIHPNDSVGNHPVGTAFDNCSVVSLFVTPDTIDCTNLGDVIFTLTAIDASGNIATCQDTAKVFLERPIVTLPTQDTVLCEGDSLLLSAIPPPNGFNYDYQWSGPTGAITQDPLTTDTVVTNVGIAQEGYYIFTIFPTSAGCPASDSVYLDVNEVQPPVLAGARPCDGDTGVINITNLSTYVGNNITYNWYLDGNLISNSQDSLIIPNMSAADSGTYSLAVTVDACYDSSAVGFTYDVLDLPPAPVPSVNLPCEGHTLTLFSNAPGYSYNWDGPSGFTAAVSDPTRPNAVQAYAGLYTLTITDANNCSNTGSVNVTISPTPPQPTLMYTQPLCDGDILTLYDSTVYNNPPILYYWENPAGGIDTTSGNQLLLSGAAAGNYMLTVSMNGCTSVHGDTQNVAYHPIPAGMLDTFSIPFRDSLVNANIIDNDVSNPNAYSITIVDSTDGGTVVNHLDGHITYTPRSGFFGTDTMYYALCDTLCPGSCDTVQVRIEVVTDFECFIPQGISPNGDGINDQVVVRCKNNYPNAVMQIFSRWGTLVYEGDPTGWNGQFQDTGKDLPDGTYFYFLKLNDTSNTGTGTDPDAGRSGDEFSGYIMLQR